MEVLELKQLVWDLSYGVVAQVAMEKREMKNSTLKMDLQFSEVLKCTDIGWDEGYVVVREDPKRKEEK